MARIVRIPPAGLIGELASPPRPLGLVVFVHGSGSSRQSPRNQFVAAELRQAGLATLLFDLLTEAEDDRDRRTAELRFDIEFLAHRLMLVLDWVQGDGEFASLATGLFGASTGGGAALVAAAQKPNQVQSVVSRGGRPDLAGNWLEHVPQPTLLIVGGLDGPVIQMNESAYQRIPARDKKLLIIPGATHLFAEPGALEQVAQAAANWFGRTLSSTPLSTRE